MTVPAIGAVVVPGGVVALTAHARAVTAADRERLAARLGDALPSGSVALVTCHRVEAYAVCANDAEANRFRGMIPGGGRLLDGEDVARHLVAVAAGLDSVVVGEDQILHQMREAIDTARRRHPVAPAIDRLFAIALRGGRRARSWREGPSRSLGDVAIDAICLRSGPIDGRQILVVGAGKMGGLAARAAVRAGASVLIANRSPDRAGVLAGLVGARISDLDPGDAGCEVAAVVVAISGPWQIAKPTADALADGTALVVDLSYPPSVPSDLGRRLGSRLITADQIAMQTDPVTVARRAAVQRLDALVERSVTELADWLARGDSRATADALVRRADRERERELAALWQRMPELDAAARAAIEGMTRHLAARLLQAPLERLGRDPDGRDGKVVRDLFAL